MGVKQNSKARLQECHGCIPVKRHFAAHGSLRSQVFDLCAFDRKQLFQTCGVLLDQ